jgi:hypothetical protein
MANGDLLWVAPLGMFKAHCMQYPGEGGAWTCIWPTVHDDCHLRFEGKKSLLQHMKAHHFIRGRDARNTKLHQSTDVGQLMSRSVEGHGFGATIGGEEMTQRNYVIPTG